MSVERLSEKASSAGLIMHIIVVLQLPPSESSRMRVSLESRYGMCWRSRWSVSAAMTLPLFVFLGVFFWVGVGG